MPWKELKPMDQRVLFIADYLREQASLSELCRRYGVSRKTGYKWIERYQAQGTEGLAEQSRRRVTQDRVPYEIREAILQLRGQGRAEVGPKKIQAVLGNRFPDAVPSRTTIYNILKEAGRITPRHKRQRRLVAAHEGPLRSTQEPNGLWSADFKGQFRTEDGRWCYPLTVMDHASRYLLGCDGLANTGLSGTRTCFERLFREYGLPDRLRTDNGTPFASTGCGGLSRLSIWWLKLGILPERIEKGKPQQNGRHERMHRTLKRQVQPVQNLQVQCLELERFQQSYNQDRPHEALGQKTPQSCYTGSIRPYPGRVPVMHYPSYMRTCKVCRGGTIHTGGKQIYVGYLLEGEWVGLEQTEEGVWRVSFGPLLLGWINEREHDKGYLRLKV
jgi:transposase InsO family protein